MWRVNLIGISRSCPRSEGPQLEFAPFIRWNSSKTVRYATAIAIVFRARTLSDCICAPDLQDCVRNPLPVAIQNSPAHCNDLGASRQIGWNKIAQLLLAHSDREERPYRLRGCRNVRP